MSKATKRKFASFDENKEWVKKMSSIKTICKKGLDHSG